MPRALATLHVDTERAWRGGEQQMAYLLDGLRRRGHGVVAVVPPDAASRPRLEAMGLEVVALPMRGEADLFAVLRLRRLLRARRPPLVHAHTSHAHGLLAWAVRGSARPADARPRLVVSRRVDLSIYRHSFLGLNGRKYRRADRILCVSEAVRRVLQADGLDGERLVVVRDAIDPERIRRATPVDVRVRCGLPTDAALVLAVGALVPPKGHEHLLAALPRVIARVPRAHLVVAGEGPLRAALEAQARALGCADRVRLPGAIDDLPGWFAAADVVAMPSVQEGLGTSLLDAMAAGRPVVASSTGGIPEVVRDGVDGRLVPPADPVALADALAEVLLDPARAGAWGRAGSARVDAEFRVERMVDETVAAYRGVLPDGGMDA